MSWDVGVQISIDFSVSDCFSAALVLACVLSVAEHCKQCVAMASSVIGVVMFAIGATPTVEIAPGVHMPRVNLGTWQLGNGKPSDPSIGVCLNFEISFELMLQCALQSEVVGGPMLPAILLVNPLCVLTYAPKHAPGRTMA